LNISIIAMPVNAPNNVNGEWAFSSAKTCFALLLTDI
jgi:hypothetical protein